MHQCEFDCVSVRVLNVWLFLENGESLARQEVEEVVEALGPAVPVHLHLHLVHGTGGRVERPEV
jgi:hypothetical protein